MELDHAKYNLLTQELLKRGYTANNPPDYAWIDSYCKDKENPLNNTEGGFTFKYWWIAERCFILPCGIHAKGSSAFTHVHIGPTNYTFEDNRPLFKCPIGCKDCKVQCKTGYENYDVLRHFCIGKWIDKEYTYKGSLEEKKKEHQSQIQVEKVLFFQKNKGKICRKQSYFNVDKQEWEAEPNKEYYVLEIIKILED